MPGAATVEVDGTDALRDDALGVEVLDGAGVGVDALDVGVGVDALDAGVGVDALDVITRGVETRALERLAGVVLAGCSCFTAVL